MTNTEQEESQDNGSGLAFGATVLERLVLAIIDANPIVSADTRQQRLNAAMKALIGKKATPHPLYNDRDDEALLFMARELHKDQCQQNMHAFMNRNNPDADPPPKIRSHKALAEQVEKHFFGSTDPQARYAIVNRLREKFSGTYQRKQGKGLAVDHERTYIYRAVEHGYVAETLEAEGLRRICDELAEWGVKTKL